MQLMVLISNKTDKMSDILSALMKVGVHGATLVNCEGMLHVLAQSGTEPVSGFFSRMSSLFDEDYEQGKLMLAVMPEALVEPSLSAIEGIIGKFSEPNTGIAFTLAVSSFKGASVGNE